MFDFIGNIKIRTKLVIVFLVTALMPLSCAVLFVVKSADDILIGKIYERYQGEVSNRLSAVDMVMRQNYNIIKSISEGGVLTRETNAPEEITAYLQRKKDIFGFESLSYFDANRVRVADTEGFGIGNQHPLEGFWLKTLNGEISAGDDIRLAPERNIPIIYLAAPVKNDENKIIGVVVARFDPRQLLAILESISQFSEDYHTTLLDKDGRIIYSVCPLYSGKILEKMTDDLVSVKKVLAGENGIIEEYIPSHQEEFITAYAHEKGYNGLADNDWSILEFISKEKALVSVVALRDKLILIILSSALLIFILGLLFAKIISDPLKKLTDISQAIAEGDLNRRVEVKSRDEIGKLAESFNEMLEKLTGAEQYARSLIEVSIDPLVTISEEGKITDVNEATVKATGIAREKIIGTDFSDYFTEPDKAREGYKEVLLKGKVVDYPLTIRHENGGLTPVLYDASVYKDKEGKIKGVFAAARDISGVKKYAARRLSEITPILQKISVGDFSQNIKIPKEEDEFTEHLVSLNLMIGDLRKTVDKNAELVKALKKEKASLEQRVKERTINLDASNRQMEAANQKLAAMQNDLQDKIIELERFNKITMGRELKILELKEELAKLKSK